MLNIIYMLRTLAQYPHKQKCLIWLFADMLDSNDLDMLDDEDFESIADEIDSTDMDVLVKKMKKLLQMVGIGYLPLDELQCEGKKYAKVYTLFYVSFR